MIDFTVAYDKLAQFNKANDIAKFLKDEGVKAIACEPDACAITVWMRDQTGLNIRTNYAVVRAVQDDNVTVIVRGSNTGAMFDFIKKFDFGLYPDLVG